MQPGPTLDEPNHGDPHTHPPKLPRSATEAPTAAATPLAIGGTPTDGHDNGELYGETENLHPQSQSPSSSRSKRKRARRSHPQPHAASSSSPPNALPNEEEAYHPDDDSEEARMHRKNIMDIELRRTRLEEDRWTLTVEAKRVRCGGCQRWIKLDARSMYYRGLWDKHRDLCRAIKRIRGEVVPKVSLCILCECDG